MRGAMMVVPIILAGGSGNRLWPLSRSAYPKQFLSLLGQRTMFQDTLIRIQGIPNILPPVVICNHEHRFIVAEQLNAVGINNATIILDPIGKNTPPAIAIAALYLQKKNPTLLILPADHSINDTKPFTMAIDEAYEYAQIGKLVTFGINPTKPETGFGYIKISPSTKKGTAYCVEQFVEKPDLKIAQDFLASRHY